MNSVAKLVIGVIIFLAGLLWYVAPIFGGKGVAPLFGVASTFAAFKSVFAGLFGFALIFFGLIIAWIEYEDIKWESRERTESNKLKEEQKEVPVKPAKIVKKKK